MLKEKLKYNYDGKFDVLYLALGDKSNSYGDDSEQDLIYLKDMDTDELTGVTIMGFLKKYISNSLPTLPIEISNVLPNIGMKLCRHI